VGEAGRRGAEAHPKQQEEEEEGVPETQKKKKMMMMRKRTYPPHLRPHRWLMQKMRRRWCRQRHLCCPALAAGVAGTMAAAEHQTG
jgi:hypothetical protein